MSEKPDLNVVRGKSLLASLRKGTPLHKNVHINSGDGLDVAIVVLSADKCLEIEMQTQEYVAANPTKANDAVRNQFYNALLCLNCMRDPEDFTTPVADNLNEIMTFMDLEDINRVIQAYGELMMNKAPKLEIITDEQLGMIKKHLEETPLSDLSTVLLVHLANCHRTIVSEN